MAAILLMPAVVLAQTGQAQAFINDVIGPQEVQSTGGLPSLALELNFTLIDGQQQVLATADIVSATMQLASGGAYPAQVAKLETPWSVVVLMDASRTLGVFSANAAFSDMRKKVANAMAQMPDGTNIAVFKFDTKPATVLDFTKDKAQVDQAIRKGFQATATGPSCLNDAAYDAVNKLSGASGRRALFIVTASADSCATRIPGDIVDLAQRNHIQIFAAGLIGYGLTKENLTALTDPTGGLTDVRELSTLNFGLDNLVLALRLQWQAKITMYPPAGQETGELQLTLNDQTQVSTRPVPFVVSKDFAQPAQLSIRGVVISIKQGIRFGLDAVSPQLIDKLNLTIVSKKTGTAVFQQDLPKLQDTYDVPVDNLVTGEGYQLQVVGLDKSGRPVAQAATDFEFHPPQSDFSISGLTAPTLAVPVFEITVASTNLDGVVKYKAWVQPDGQDTTQLNTITVPIGEPILIPTTNLATGVYVVGVQAIDSSNTALAQAISTDKVTYTKPSSLDLLLKQVKESPVAITIVTVVGCLAFFVIAFVVWMMLPKRTAKLREVELVVPEIRRRAPPVNLDSSRSSRPPREAPPQQSGAQQAPPRQAPAQPERAARQPAAAAAAPAAAPAGGLPPACLTALAPAGLNVSISITKPSFTIGRRDGNDLVLSVDNKVGVSSHHATIKFVDGRYMLVDDKSTFGTFLNDRKLAPSAPNVLDEGAVIGLGPKVKLKFQMTNCP